MIAAFEYIHSWQLIRKKAVIFTRAVRSQGSE